MNTKTEGGILGVLESVTERLNNVAIHAATTGNDGIGMRVGVQAALLRELQEKLRFANSILASPERERAWDEFGRWMRTYNDHP